MAGRMVACVPMGALVLSLVSCAVPLDESSTSVTSTTVDSAGATSTSVDSASVTSTSVDSTSIASSIPSAVDATLVGGDWVVIGVTDGDTVVVTGPDGEQRVRLIGINTPESDECFGDESTAATSGLVAGRRGRLVAGRSDTDQYGRLLRFIEVVSDSGDIVDVGAELVAGGFALSRRYPPDTDRNDGYDELQDRARLAEAGLWAPDACGEPDVAGLGEVRLRLEIEADAPGDDGQNPNGEWVRFTNEASTALDLTDWEIADESASHRYRFGSFVLAPGASVTLYSGCGPDSTTERYWCNEGSAVWNNSGDTVFVKDPSGNIVIAETYRG
ncbi:MAG: lamin tail domain-containing protein [Ilumatobacteraceae bacterium]